MSVPSSPLAFPLFDLICSPIKQPYSKVDNCRMYRYRNAVFTSNFYQKYLRNKKVPLSTSHHKAVLNENLNICRSSLPEISRYFAKFTGKHMRQSLFFNKVAGLFFLHFSACIQLDLNDISFFLVHIMDQIGSDILRLFFLLFWLNPHLPPGAYKLN